MTQKYIFKAIARDLMKSILITLDNKKKKIRTP
jgi:hypothetical protein